MLQTTVLPLSARRLRAVRRLQGFAQIGRLDMQTLAVFRDGAPRNQNALLTQNIGNAVVRQQGILVARRTVAKYREGMNIQAANLRKSL